MAMPNPQQVLDDLKLQDAFLVADLFDDAAEANLADPLRQGATVTLPNHGRLVMSGDLHDNGLNFQRLLTYARLDESSDHHLLLQELVHGSSLVNGMDMSIRLSAKVAALKVAMPTQIHLLQANHDLAQARGDLILKNGHSVVEAFESGVDHLYGDGYEDVMAAYRRFVFSMPLALRCPCAGMPIQCTHSLPSEHLLVTFDPTVLDRLPTPDDLCPKGSAYQLVWGRHHKQELADRLAQAWGMAGPDGTHQGVFVLGHQPAEMGFEVQGQTMVILSSDHSHGVALAIDLARNYTRDELLEIIKPLAAIRLDQK